MIEWNHRPPNHDEKTQRKRVMLDALCAHMHRRAIRRTRRLQAAAGLGSMLVIALAMVAMTRTPPVESNADDAATTTCVKHLSGVFTIIGPTEQPRRRSVFLDTPHGPVAHWDNMPHTVRVLRIGRKVRDHRPADSHSADLDSVISPDPHPSWR